ncbi:ABC transporter substrate-binding protein [Ruminococcus sp.]|uniref:ABC transporter substrate-binding protein n=1 Tax=Ruminococcus sp. TaxID=41978 RepID=UPI0025FF167C|nr:ABC transporter substrate-binding protein [Ruminococcus sp.]MCR4639205.1 ABC transporter substrate-binding protein [Ruminococcus sp.]
MSDIKRIIAAFLAVGTVFSAASCSKKNTKSSSTAAPESAVSTAKSSTEPVTEAGSMDIVWLSDFDLNPEGDQRSSALSIFEDVYGGSIKFVSVPPAEKLIKLDQMIQSGDEVDMFPYDMSVFPEGILKDRFLPLDPYFGEMGVDEGMWKDMSAVIDKFAYKGKHYVVPFSVSEPQLITYSRKLIQSEGMEDPYTLYKDGKWDWNVFNNMINKFSESESSLHHFGISGFFGRAILASSGKTVVGFDGDKLTNNIKDGEIAQAENIMRDLQSRWLYNKSVNGQFMTDMNTLFYASSDLTLATSNRVNPEADLMIVPFPKSPNADKNYIACDYDARMLVKNSKKGRAVATYLKCERMAASDEGFTAKKKEQALKTMTEEQYNALQEYISSAKANPVVELGYGMGENMLRNGDCNFDTRGAMDNITSALLEGGAPVGSWEELRDRMSPIIDEEIKKY